MTSLVVADVAMASLASSQSTTGAQPTAQQVARFEQQLQASGAGDAQYYQAPVAGASGNWQGVMSNVGELAERYRLDSVSLDGAPVTADVPQRWHSHGSHRASNPVQAAEVLAREMSQLSRMSYTMMSIGFVTSTERVAGENVRSLFQLS